MQIFIFTVVCLVNVIAFALYGIDKTKAKLDTWRIAEKSLLIWSFIGGIGGMVGMKIFRHKTLQSRQHRLGSAESGSDCVTFDGLKRLKLPLIRTVFLIPFNA